MACTPKLFRKPLTYLTTYPGRTCRLMDARGYDCMQGCNLNQICHDELSEHAALALQNTYELNFAAWTGVHGTDSDVCVYAHADMQTACSQTDTISLHDAVTLLMRLQGLHYMYIGAIFCE